MNQILHRRPAAAEDNPEQQAAAVRTLLEGCANPGVTRHALMVRVADLPPDLRRAHHLRVIQATMDPLRNLDRAGMFELADGTLLAIWRGDGGETLRTALTAMELLFADLAEAPVALLELPRDSAILAQTLTDSMPRPPAPVPSSARPLDVATLARLEAVLAHTDVAPYARRRPICTWPAGTRARLAWEKRFLAVDRLVETLAPGIAPQADAWLFRRLTRSFDRRVLALLSDPWELRDAGPFALDLNVCSLVGSEFLRFDAALPSPFRHKVLLCIHPADILSDAAGFAFARDFARARGYKLALRGVTVPWLHVFPPDLLNVDYVRLRAPRGDWPRLPDGVAARTILCGVDDQAALAWGRAQGVALFEGPAVQPDPETLPKFNLRRR